MVSMIGLTKDTVMIENCSVATTSATALTEMNPLVTVTSRKLESISGAQDIQDFDVVVLVGGTFTEQFRINKWCRTHNAKFFAARSIGGYAHFFVDLQTHDYSIKVCMNLFVWMMQVSFENLHFMFCSFFGSKLMLTLHFFSECQFLFFRAQILSKDLSGIQLTTLHWRQH